MNKYVLPKISDAPISAEVHEGIRLCAKSAIKVLGVPSKSRHSVILEALDAFVYGWQRGTRPDPLDLTEEDAPFTLGSLWGTIMAARFEWEWVRAVLHDESDKVAHAVVSHDRSLAIFPMHFLRGCMHDPTVEVTLMLAYNKLKAGHVGEHPPGGYFDLMQGLHRIVPAD